MESFGENLVVVGGTAQRLFEHHPLGKSPGYEPLTTEDVDLALPIELATDAPEDLLTRLKGAGFSDEVRGGHTSIHRYPLEGHDSVYLQFLSRRMGDRHSREGRRVTSERFGGIVAELLAKIEVLLHRPWRHQVTDQGTVVSVSIVNPVAYVTHKLLVLEKRHGPKRAKDVLYLLDTLAVFSSNLRRLGQDAPELAPSLSPKARRQIEKQIRSLSVPSELTAAAAEEAAHRSRPPSSGSVAAALKRGLPMLLAGLVTPE